MTSNYYYLLRRLVVEAMPMSNSVHVHVILDINECASNPCLSGNTIMCIDEVNAYSCQCNPDHTGLHCESRKYRNNLLSRPVSTQIIVGKFTQLNKDAHYDLCTHPPVISASCLAIFNCVFSYRRVCVITLSKQRHLCARFQYICLHLRSWLHGNALRNK